MLSDARHVLAAWSRSLELSRTATFTTPPTSLPIIAALEAVRAQIDFRKTKRLRALRTSRNLAPSTGVGRSCWRYLHGRCNGRALLAFGLIRPTLVFATFLPAVMVCALIGGRCAGLLSIALSIVAVWWALTEPYYSFGPANLVTVANFTPFSLSSLAIIWLALVHRQLVFNLEDNERERQILAGEIQHRSKNLVSVFGSLVRQTVTEERGGRAGGKEVAFRRRRFAQGVQGVGDTGWTAQRAVRLPYEMFFEGCRSGQPPRGRDYCVGSRNGRSYLVGTDLVLAVNKRSDADQADKRQNGCIQGYSRGLGHGLSPMCGLNRGRRNWPVLKFARSSRSVGLFHPSMAAADQVGLRGLAAPRRLYRGDVDFLHAHHGIECPLCFVAAGSHRFRQRARGDLPGNAPLVLAPAARTFLASIAHDGVPEAVGLLLIIGGDLE